MRRRELLSMTAAIAAAGPTAGWAAPKAVKHGTGTTKAKPADDSLPHLLGSPQAKRRFVLFGSYSCAFTAELEPLLRKLQAENPKTVSVEWRHFPIHTPDPAIHAAVQTLKGDAFWSFTNDYYDVFLDKGAPPRDDKLAAFFAAHGGAGASMEAAYADQAAWAAVKRDFVAGRLLGVTATPGLFVDGYFLTPDGLPLDLKAFEASLRAMIAQA